MKTVTGHVIAPCAIVHVRPNIHIFNPSDSRAYVEVTDTGEIHVHPLDYGRLIISYMGPEDK